MKKLHRSILAALALPLAFLPDELRAEEMIEPLSNSRVIAELQAGQKFGGDLDLLVPLYGNASHFWYGDLQAYGYDSMYRTYGIGGGHRQIINDAIYGFYGFFDRQISTNQIYYNRYNLGVERLGETWDVRANLYLYANTNSTNIVDRGIQSASIQGNRILYAYLYDIEKVYNGGDVEVGRTLGLDNLRGYLGYYNFGNVIKGPKARIEYQVNSRLALSASTQTDIRGWLTYAGVSYWFGKTTLPSATGIESRMLDPVVRDMTVAATITNGYTEYDVDPNKIYFVSPEGSAANPGTQVAPMTAQQASTTANANDFIYFLGDQPINLGGNFTVKEGQKILGNSANVTQNGYPLLVGDPTKPSVFTGGSFVIDGAATLNGFDVTNTATNATSVAEETTQNGIVINGSENVTLSNINITGYTGAGIDVVGNSTVTLTNVTSTANGSGLLIESGNVTISGTTNSFSDNTSGAGIATTGSGTLLAAQNVTTSGNAGDGVSLGGTNTYTSTLSKITSQSNTGNGYNISNENITVNASTLNGDSNTQNGLAISAGSIAVSGTNSFSTNTLGGITVTDTGALTNLQTATLSGNTGGDGLSLGGTSTYTSTLSNIMSQSNTGNGYNISNANVTVNASTLNGDSNTASGLAISAGSMAVTGSINSFSSNEGDGGVVITGTGALTHLENATVSSNSGGDGLLLDGTGTYTSTLSNITSQNNSDSGYVINNSNITVDADTLHGDTNGLNGMAIYSGNVSITGATGAATNSFSHNVTGSGILVSDTGKLILLTNATASNNLNDGVRLDGTATVTTTLTNITSQNNSDVGFYIINPNITVNADTLHGDTNFLAGMMISGGTVSISGTNANTFSSNTAGYGILVNGTGLLTQLENATLSSNSSSGLLMTGTGTATTLTNVITNTNGGDGININAENADVTIANITSNNNTAGSGLWIENGIVTDGGSTANQFKNNSAYGVLVGTSTTSSAGRLISLTNADTSSNTKEGILLNSSNTTDTVTLDNITSSSSRTGNGVWIKQAGTVNFTTSAVTSLNKVSGIRVDNTAAIVNMENVTSDSNEQYGLRIAKAASVTVNGDENNFSSNGIFGVFFGTGTGTITSAMSMSNATVSSNAQNGIAIWNVTGTSTITDVTMALNTTDGLNVVNSTVTASDISIHDNLRDGIYAATNATTTVTGSSSIYGNNGGGLGYAIEAQSGSTVTVNNPTKLLGVIANTGSSASTITVVHLGNTDEITDTNQTLTCNIESGDGTCT